MAAATLAEAFLQDAVSMCARVPDATTILFRGGESAGELPEWLSDLTCLPQTGGNLGDRMAAAFAQLLSGGGTEAVLIGSDSPTLTPWFLETAFKALENNDVVLGPTIDGGYYLVGMKTHRPEIFSGIPWSTSRVLLETLKRLQGLGLRSMCIDSWYDVDTHEALMFLVQDLGRRPTAEGAVLAPATRQALARLGLLES